MKVRARAAMWKRRQRPRRVTLCADEEWLLSAISASKLFTLEAACATFAHVKPLRYAAEVDPKDL